MDTELKVKADERVRGRLEPTSFVREDRGNLDDFIPEGSVSSVETFGTQKECLEPAIDERLLEVVLDVIRDLGVEALKSRVKVQSIFSERLSSFGKEKHIVRMAIREGMIAKLYSVATESATTQRVALATAAEYMYDELGMDYKSSCAVLMTFQAAINKSTPNLRGKSTCHKLKEMRQKFAEANGIDFYEEECTYDGPCNGTCPYCDSKTRELTNKAKALQKNGTIVYPTFDIGSEVGEIIRGEEMACGTAEDLIEEGYVEEEFSMGEVLFYDSEKGDIPFE